MSLLAFNFVLCLNCRPNWFLELLINYQSRKRKTVKSVQLYNA